MIAISNSNQLVLQFSTSAPASFKPFSEGWKNRYSKAIRILGHTYFSHCDFRVSMDKIGGWLEEDPRELHAKYGNYGLLGASDNPDAPIIAGNSRGVAIRTSEYQSFGIRRIMILQTPKADEILEWTISQIGKPFDSAALSPKVFLSDPFVGDVEARDWRDPHQWFCMELIICAFENGNYWGPGVKVPIKKNRVTPADGTMVFMMDPNLLNRTTWLDPIKDVRMGRHEI